MRPLPQDDDATQLRRGIVAIRPTPAPTAAPQTHLTVDLRPPATVVAMSSQHPAAPGPTAPDATPTDHTSPDPGTSVPAVPTAQPDDAAQPAPSAAAHPAQPAPSATAHPAQPAPSATAQPGPDPQPRTHTRRNVLLGGGAALLAGLAGTGYWAADRYLIEHVEVTDASAYEAANTSVAAAAATEAATAATDVTVTDSGYTSSQTSLAVTQVSTGSGSDTVTYYVADLTVSTALTLRSAFAKDSFGENVTEKTSTIAAANDAVFAVNGDYYGFRSTGIVIRNGVAYRDEPARTGLAFYTDGSVKVYDETATSAQALLDAGVWHTLSFGPALVDGGTVQDGIDQVEVDTNIGNHSIQGEQPRTAIGAVADNHYVMVVVDGRDEGYSRGVTMGELAQIMADLGCQVAYNLDGGGSSTMYLNGSVINRPSNGGERATSDILYVRSGS